MEDLIFKKEYATGHLEQWYFKYEGTEDVRLMGECVAHSKKPHLEGRHIYTSLVIEFSEEEHFAVTMNTRYSLGKKRD